MKKNNLETPLKRFFHLLNLDKKDIFQVLLYAVFSGLVSLSLPLGIQSIINLIQGGRVSLSWIILVVIIIIGVTFNGVLKLMQLRITESIQQKIFIRSSFEFVYRFTKIKHTSFNNIYPPELSNRFFDTITIQKSMSKLLLDYSEALLQMLFGLLLLSLYHPFFIIFGMLLFVVLYCIFKFNFENGLKTSIKESNHKYNVAHWIQEIARNYIGFKNKPKTDFALSKNDALVLKYINSRETHFSIIKKQFIQLIGIKVIITGGLLLIGGFLVINQQMNLGQFVAAEIIILFVINSVEKIIVGLETFYDLLTSIEKISQITELETEENYSIKNNTFCYKNIYYELDALSYSHPDSTKKTLNNISLKINQSDLIYLEGSNSSGKSTLIRILAAILEPKATMLYINDTNIKKINLDQYRSQIGLITIGQSIFEGTLIENITFNNPQITNEHIKHVLEKVNLTEYIRKLPNGLDERILTDGKQLSSSVAQKILLARAIITKPKVLLLEDPFDKMDESQSKELIDFLCSKENSWTIIVVSKNKYWKQKCNRIITLDNGRLISDINTNV